MNVVEGIFLWTAMAVYVVSLVSALIGWVFKKPGGERFGQRAFPVALVLHFAAGISRWVATGHAPVMYAYENSVTGSWFVGVIFLVLAWRIKGIRRGLIGVITLVMLMLGLGLTEPQHLQPLAPPFKSGWLVVHVLFAWLTFGAYLVSGILAATYLVIRFKNPKAAQEQAEAVARAGSAAPAEGAGPAEGEVPAEGEAPATQEEVDPEVGARLSRLDEACGRLIVFGFVADVVMLATGALWAHGLWGRYWQWDPVETWAFVSWMAYGIYLHLRFTMGWTGTKAAVLAIFAGLTVVVTFFGIDVMANVHAQVL